MRFNPDPSKQAREAIFSRKDSILDLVYFNHTILNQVSQKKHLRLILGKPVSLEDSVKTVY